MAETSTGTSIVSWVSLALAIIGMVVGAVNHKRIRSRCFGAERVISIDVENTTPKGEKVEAIDAPRRSERLKEKEEAKESVPVAE
jgi:hypothetical protein